MKFLKTDGKKLKTTGKGKTLKEVFQLKEQQFEVKVGKFSEQKFVSFNQVWRDGIAGFLWVVFT